MLDSVVKLTEKLTELFKYRAERRAQIFEDIIKPMYLAHKNVHWDYLSIFEAAKAELASDRALSEIAESLALRRIAEEAERHAILQHAKTLSVDKSLEECHPFFAATVDYFETTPFTQGGTHSSSLRMAVDNAAREQSVIQTNSSSKIDPWGNLTEAIERALIMLRKNWQCVSDEYAKSL